MLGNSARAQSKLDRSAEPPFILAKEGYFYVGGTVKPNTLVMVQGGSTTGTPDDREGWPEYFVRRGYAV